MNSAAKSFCSWAMIFKGPAGDRRHLGASRGWAGGSARCRARHPEAAAWPPGAGPNQQPGQRMHGGSSAHARPGTSSAAYWRAGAPSARAPATARRGKQAQAPSAIEGHSAVRSCVRMRWISRTWSGTVSTATVRMPIDQWNAESEDAPQQPVDQPFGGAPPTTRRLRQIDHDHPPVRGTKRPPRRELRSGLPLARDRHRAKLPSCGYAHASVAAALLVGRACGCRSSMPRRESAGVDAGAHAVDLAGGRHDLRPQHCYEHGCRCAWESHTLACARTADDANKLAPISVAATSTVAWMDMQLPPNDPGADELTSPAQSSPQPVRAGESMRNIRASTASRHAPRRYLTAEGSGSPAPGCAGSSPRTRRTRRR